MRLIYMILPVHSDKMKFACLKWFVFPFILFVEDKILGVKMNVQNGLKICCDSEKELIDTNLKVRLIIGSYKIA